MKTLLPAFLRRSRSKTSGILSETPRPPHAESSDTFFVTGGTLLRDAPSYVVRRADDELFERLMQREFCYVLMARQMGKSSLMIRTAVRLRQAKVTVAVLDLTAVGQNLTAAQWYRGLLGRLGRQLEVEEELEERWQRGEGIGPLQRWVDTIGEVLLTKFTGPIVLFVDEIDAVRSLPFSADEFFAAIRACYNQRAEDPEFNRLTFCLLGVATPAELIKDTRISPFNIGHRIELTDFTLEEAKPLEAGLMQAPEVLERILYWTGGHPYLTQRLCRAVVESRIATATQVDAVCGALFFTQSLREKDDNLLFVQDRLLRSDGDVAPLLNIYRRVRSGKIVREEETGGRGELLRLSGVVYSDNIGRLRVRNRIYAHVFDRKWIQSNLPEGELRRQREAYRNGLIRAICISGLIIVVMGILLWRASLAENSARNAVKKSLVAEKEMTRQKDRAEALLYDADMALTWRHFQDGDVNTARNLFEQCLQGDTNRFEARLLKNLCRPVLMEFPTSYGNIVAARFMPDGATIRMVTEDQSVLDWKPSETKAKRILPGFDQKYSGYVSALSQDGSLAAFERPLSVESRTLGVGTAVVFAGHGLKRAGAVTISGDYTICLFDLKTGQVRSILRGHRRPFAKIRFSPDGSRIVSGDKGGVVKMWQTDTGRELWSIGKYWGKFGEELIQREGNEQILNHEAAYSDIIFSPDSKWVALVSSVGVVIRNSVTGDVIFSKTDTFTDGGTFLADSKRFFWYNRNSETPYSLDIYTKKIAVVPKSFRRPLSSFLASPNGRWAVEGCYGDPLLWDINTGKQKWTLPISDRLSSFPHQEYPFRPHEFSPDGNQVILSDGVRKSVIWNLVSESGPAGSFYKAPSEYEADRERRKFLEKSGAIALCLDWQGRLCIWDVAKSKLIFGAIKYDENGRSSVFGVRLSPDLRYLAICGSGVNTNVDPPLALKSPWAGTTVQIIDLHNSKAVRTISGNGSVTRCLDYSRDGKVLAVVGQDPVTTGQGENQSATTARLFEAATGRCLGIYPIPLVTRWQNSLRVSFISGNRIFAVTGDDGMIWFFDRAKKRPVWMTQPRSQKSVGFLSISRVSNEGDQLFLVDQTGLRIWKLAGGLPTSAEPYIASQYPVNSSHAFMDLEGDIAGAVISPDGKTIARGSLGGRLQLFDSTTGRETITLDTPGLEEIAAIVNGGVKTLKSARQFSPLRRPCSRSLRLR